MIARLTALWADVLECADCPIQSSFMDLGGDSISAVQLVSRVRDIWGVSIPLEALMDGLTIEAMAQQIEHALQASSRHTWPPIAAQRRDVPLPLSHSQRRMWLVQSFAPETSGYNVYFAMRLEGTLDVARLQRAVDAVWARHDTFRTRFVMAADGPYQQVDPPDTLSCQLIPIDLLGQGPREVREQLALTILSQTVSAPFDLSASPPWRLALVRVDEQCHILVWVAHHILIDLWANLVVARELAQAYSAASDAPASLTASPTLGCADLGAWQQDEAVQRLLAPQLSYWKRQLDRLTPSNLPTDRDLDANWHRSAGRVVVDLPGHTLSKLRTHAAVHGHTPYMVLLATLSVLLSRQSRQEDIAVITPVANRQHPQTEHIVGSLTNTVILRTQVQPAMRFGELLDQVKQTTLAAMTHQDLPFDQLVEQLESRHRHFDLPLGLQVMLNVGNAPAEGIGFAGLQTQRILLDRGGAQFPLAITVDLDLTRTILLEYADRVWTHHSAQALLTHYLSLLDTVLDRPDLTVAQLHWQSPAQQPLMQTWNDTDRVWPAWPSVDAWLSAQAQSTPQAWACRGPGCRLRYADLQARVEALASHLQTQGIGRGHRVGIHLSRGVASLIALRAVWMTGAAYVPLDIRQPAQRLHDMAQDAGLSLVLSTSWPSASGHAPIPCLDPADAPPLPGDHAFEARTPPSPQDPAYLIYTSGSTGQPKGVVVAHRSLLNFLHSMALEPGIGPQDTLLAVTTLTFDIAALELLLPLTVGAEVVIAQDDDAMDGQALSGLIEQHRVTMMQATPSTWRAMLDAGWSGVGPRPFKALIGGEALTPMLARQLLPLCTELWNMYGPTETTVWSTCWRVQDPDHGIYIGRPIANTRVRIVDACGHDCPIGIPGEIVIEGDGVTDGYWQRDELTAQRFLMDIRDNGRPDRAYRTGDLGRWTWSGQLQHLGRLDHQIKVRGHRIEPGDIEAQFMRQPEVAQCVVLLREDQPGDQRLVAYVVRHDPDAPEPDATRWRQTLRQHLPDYMVPQHVVWLKALPLLRNGKLDRHALPAPTTTPSARGEAPAITLTAWEARLAEVWRELLHIPSVTPTDNFFDLGGYSLLAMQAISRLAETTGIRISPRHYIFETLGQLAHTYAQAGSSSVAAHDASTTTPNSRMKTPATAKADAPTPSLFRRLLQSLRS